MDAVNILDARNRLSQLIAAAGAGDEVVIAKRGKPVVRLVPVGGTQSYTAAQAAIWLTTNHPTGVHRSPDELDAQIASEREGWE